MKVRTHTFRAGRYKIDELDGPLEGVCELPDESENLYIMFPGASTCKALCTAIHEMMHAEGVPPKLLDTPDDDSAERIGRLLWRLGWRRTKQ